MTAESLLERWDGQCVAVEQRQGLAHLEVLPPGARCVAADPYTKDLMVAALETDCRGGKLRSLQWSEVRGDVLVILPAKAEGPGSVAFGSPRRCASSSTNAGTDRTGVRCRRPPTCSATRSADRSRKRKAGVEAGNDVHIVRDVLGRTSVTMTNTYHATEDEGQAARVRAVRGGGTTSTAPSRRSRRLMVVCIPAVRRYHFGIESARIRSKRRHREGADVAPIHIK